MTNRNQRPHPVFTGPAIGGAIITRSFELPANAPDDVRQPGNPRRARVGRPMSAELVRSMKNRRALEEGGYIKMLAAQPGHSEVDPAPLLQRIRALELELAQAKEAGGDRFRYAFHTGMGKYDVIEGLRLNSAPLSKDEANALAAGHEPPAR